MHIQPSTASQLTPWRWLRSWGVLLCCSLLSSLVWAQEAGWPADIKHPATHIWVGGQLNEAELKQVAGKGVATVINLRPVSETNWDEGKVVQGLGMRYINLPISGKDDVTVANARKLKALLDQQKGEVYLHCASGNRVGALAALMVADEGADLSRSLELGKAWGLGSLEDHVMAVIQSGATKHK